MAIDFQMIEAYDVDMENFSYDVSDMIDNIYIGPQGELLEKLELFNHNYNTNIGVTKSFTLKPGGYDEIKKAHARWVMRYDMRPRGIRSIFDRIQQYSWRASGFKQELIEIDSRMKNLKQSGMRWQDNTDQFEDEFSKLKSSIINALDQTREMYPSVSIECKIIPVNEGRLAVYRRRGYFQRSVFPDNMFSEEAVDFILMIYLKIKDMDMMVHVMDGDSAVSEYRMSMGDVYIASGTYLLPLISRHWGRTTPVTANPQSGSYSFFLEALYLSEMFKSYHPYIGKPTDKYAWELKSRAISGNICTGNMDMEIRNSLLNNELMAHIVQLITWVTNYYVPQTHPLNRIKMMKRYGDDIKFIQWRNDLNSTSSEVFESPDGALPQECHFGEHLSDNTRSYARNQDANSYYHNSDIFDVGSVEYLLRTEEYLKKISLIDMPCNNCGFKSECNQWNVLQLIFKDSLTPEEEARFGTLYEFHDFEVNILHRREAEGYIEIPFAELALNQAWRWDQDGDYLTLDICHKMCIWWSYSNNESFTASSSRYRQRMRQLYNMHPRTRNHLLQHHYLNDESDFVWTLDNVINYKLPLLKRKLKREEVLEDLQEASNETDRVSDDVIRDWLNDDEPMPFDAPNREDLVIEEENMTPEQRAIQWAVNNGGAQNL